MRRLLGVLPFVILSTGNQVDAAQTSRSVVGRAPPPAFTIDEISIAILSDAKVGSVRSGMLCTPNGSLRWRQIAVPAPEAIRRAAETAVIARQPAVSERVTLKPNVANLSIDRAEIRVCRAWMGMGNAPKGKGSLTLRWRSSPSSARPLPDITVEEPLSFDGRDPREDAGVVLDAITSAAVKYGKAIDSAR